jgi:hypothetical protein
VKLTPKQEMHLRNIKASDGAWRTAKRDAMVRAQIVAAQEDAQYLFARDREVRLGVDAGIPKLQIRRVGLGTSDSRTLEDSLHRTAGLASTLEVSEVATDPRWEPYGYVQETDTLSVHLDAERLSGAFSAMEVVLPPGDAVERLSLSRALFSINTRDDGSRYIASLTERWIPQLMAEHPVVNWMDSHEAEAFEYVDTLQAVGRHQGHIRTTMRRP